MQYLPQLSKPQATVLALWSFGMVRARSCALPAVSHWLAQGMQRQEQTVRQQRRAWYDDTPRQRGAKRPALHVEPWFPALLAGVVSWWQGTPWALAIAATALGARFVVWAVRVVYRGCAIPVAWVVLPANTTHAWRREWLRLLRQRRPALPRGWTVLVLADRGLYAPWLLRRLVRLGWHPWLRLNTGGSLRPLGAPGWRIRMKLSINSRHKCDGSMLVAQALPQYLCCGLSCAGGLAYQTFCGSTGPLEKAVQDALGLHDGVHPPVSQGLAMPDKCEPTQFPFFLAP